MAVQHCPPERFSDTSQYAYRRCEENGHWSGKTPNDTLNIMGWTNYTPCFPPDIRTLLKVYDHSDAQIKYTIALATRYMEMVGFSMSFFMVGWAILIFSHYRSLRNTRTRIHKSLFFAMQAQVILRLIIYIDQALLRNTSADQLLYPNATMKGIDNTPYLCEGVYILMEYAISVMFMWMFIEGMYLHNVVTANSLRERFTHWILDVIGWGFPFIFTTAWAIANSKHYAKDDVKRCWYGYNFLSLYWIVQGPRLAVILINLVFLLNIMKVLIVKLKRSENSEVVMVRKAVRAALVLLPLLGITNILNMTEPSLDCSVWQFAIWSLVTHFLRSFQGFLISVIYCFMNGEVRQVLSKDYDNYKEERANSRRHRQPFSMFEFLMRLFGRCCPRRRQRDPRIVNRVPTPSKPSWLQVSQLGRGSGEVVIPCEFEMQPMSCTRETIVEAGPSTSEQEARNQERDSGVSEVEEEET